MTDDVFRKVLTEFGFPALFALILLYIIDRHGSAVAAAQVKLMQKLGTAIEIMQREITEIRVTQSIIATKVLESWRPKPPNPDQPSQNDQNGP